VAAALCGAAVGVGYFYRQQPPTLEMTVAVPPPNATPQPPLQSTPAVESGESPAPQRQSAPAPDVETRDRQESQRQPIEVVVVLDRWAEAIRQGRVDRAAGFYAPAVRAGARARIRAMLGPARRMDVFRLSETAVIHAPPNGAVATFRQHWQSGVGEKTVGEQGVRITLRAHRDGWQIVSEQVEQVHWIQKIQ